MSNLSTIRTFALRTRWFPAATSFGGGIASRAAECTFLFLACKAAFFVAVETAEFGFEAGGNRVSWRSNRKEKKVNRRIGLQSLVAGIYFSIASRLERLESENTISQCLTLKKTNGSDHTW